MKPLKPLKLGIYKRLILDDKGHYRWFGADYNPEIHSKLKKRPKLPVIDLRQKPHIKTERQFLRFLYENWGDGTYMVMAFLGYGRIIVFWKGDINEDGYKFYKQTYSRKEMNEWKRFKAKDEYEAKKKLQEGDIEGAKEHKTMAKEAEEYVKEAKQEALEKRKSNRYGFLPYLKPTGRRGYFNFWNDPNVKETEFEWGLDKEEEKQAHKNWGEIKRKEFEVW